MAIESEEECEEQDFVYYTPPEALDVVLGRGKESDASLNFILANPPLSKETNNVK